MNSKSKMGMPDAGRLGWEASKAKHEKRWAEYKIKYSLSPKKCKTCNLDLPYEKREQKFCSHSCAASWCNSGIARRANPILTYTCRECHSEFKSRRPNLVFCSLACSCSNATSRSNDRIENGLFTNVHPSPTLRRYLSEKRGGSCEVCHLSEWMGNPIPLNVHHVDGNAANNLPENLKLLCLNCHGQTDTYLNKGGRKSARRYRQVQDANEPSPVV